MRAGAFAVLGILLHTTMVGAMDVFPGPGTPLQDAIDAASDGALLVVHGGGYPEVVTITKRLRLMHPTGEGNFAVIGDVNENVFCDAPTVLTIVASRVRVENIDVAGGTFSTIDVHDSDRVTLNRVTVYNRCNTAEYGVNIFASTHVKVFEVKTYPLFGSEGYNDAGFYLGGIPARGAVRLKKCFSSEDDERGILIEDSAPRGVVVQNSAADFSRSAGIFLRNSDGVLLKDNSVTSSRGTGIELDATSDDNDIVGNGVFSTVVADVVDAGSGNCWRRNTFSTGTVPPCP
jgi:parallel beta-helix repeat protein